MIERIWKGFLGMFNWPAVFMTGGLVLVCFLIAIGVFD